MSECRESHIAPTIYWSSHEPIGSCAPPRENSRFPDPFPVQFRWGFLSRWPELNRRPTPSLTPCFCEHYTRARLYLKRAPTVSEFSFSCQSFEPSDHACTERQSKCYGLGPCGLLTVIRDSSWHFRRNGQGLRPTMELLYQLSYIGLYCLLSSSTIIFRSLVF